MLIGLILSGCQHITEKPIDISTEHTSSCATPPTASPIGMRDFVWVVVIDKDGRKWVAISPEDYEKLSLNMADIIAMVEQKNSIISYYKKCIARE